MVHNIQESKDKILKVLAKRKIKHQFSDFDSGCCMIDIWKGDKFYVVQIEHDSIGVSLIVPNTIDLSTIPDNRFYDLEKFTERFNEILEE